MPATSTAPTAAEPEGRIVIHGISWGQYVRIADTLVDRPNPRMIYLDGELTFLTKSRRHDWLAERLGDFVKIVAAGCDILWEDAAQATYRREQGQAGVEGDKTFYFNEHAAQMLGSKNIDLETQPPPDLAIEVEVSHPADVAVSTWGRIGVPEIWRYDAEAEVATFWARREDGTYAPIDRSLGLPVLTPEDVRDQLRSADSLGSARWSAQLGDWVRAVLRPRMGNG